MDIAKAITHMLGGASNLITRKAWAPDMFIRIETPYCSPFPDYGDQELEHLPFVQVKTSNNKFQPWVPTHQDLLARDYEIYTSQSGDEDA